MAWFKPAHLFRALRQTEIDLAREVFHQTLPPLDLVGVTDGLGMDGTIWTLDRWTLDALQSGPPKTLDRLRYFLNVGDAVRWDLTSSNSLYVAVNGYKDRARDVFVHEMTHVWQFHRGDSVKVRSIYAQHVGAGYQFTRGAPFEDYNVEQQASIVEKWNEERKDSGENDELFPYIHYIIRREGSYNFSVKEFWSKTLSELQLLLDMERQKVAPVQVATPVRITAQDDSLAVMLSGDVLFDINKAIVKPVAYSALQQAAVKIKAKVTPRLRAILINGHTDNTGDPAYNVQLSEKRAQAVADWFTSRGLLPGTTLRPQGFGMSQPRAPNSDETNRAKNRRVEIYMHNG